MSQHYLEYRHYKNWALMYLLAFYVVPLVYVQSFVTYVVMYLFIKTLQLHHQRDPRLQHTILNKEIILKALTSQTYNLCNPFNPDLRCASLWCWVFFFKKERREKRGRSGGQDWKGYRDYMWNSFKLWAQNMALPAYSLSTYIKFSNKHQCFYHEYCCMLLNIMNFRCP